MDAINVDFKDKKIEELVNKKTQIYNSINEKSLKNVEEKKVQQDNNNIKPKLSKFNKSNENNKLKDELNGTKISGNISKNRIISDLNNEDRKTENFENKIINGNMELNDYEFLKKNEYENYKNRDQGTYFSIGSLKNKTKKNYINILNNDNTENNKNLYNSEHINTDGKK